MLFAANTINSWIVDQGWIWIDINGEPHCLADMDYSYLFNVQQWLVEHVGTIYRLWLSDQYPDEDNDVYALMSTPLVTCEMTHFWLKCTILWNTLDQEIHTRNQALFGVPIYQPLVSLLYDPRHKQGY